MKKIIFFILVFVAVQSFGQNRFPSIDSAKNYSLRYIRNSTVESFTNLRMQNVVYGTLELLDSLAGAGVIDTIFISTGDTLKYKIGSTTFVVGKVGGSGGSYTAGNGLTLSGSEFRLGGTLSVNTQIISPFLNDFTLTTRGSSGDNNRSDLLMQNGSLFAYGYSGGSPNRTISISSSILQMATDVSSAYLGAPNIYFQSGFSSGAAYAQTTTDTTTFKPLVLNTSTGLVSRLTSWPTGGSTPNLQAVLDAGSNLTNGYTISSIEPFTIQSTDGVNVGSLLTDVGSASIFSSGSSNTSRIDVIQDSLIFKPHLGRISIDTFAVRSTDTTINKPITYNISTKRMEYLQGWPTGGISDTSRIVTTDKTQSITGRKTFNAATYINKDSLPITTGKLWHIVVDTPTNQLMRQQVSAGGITGSGSANRITYWDGASSVTSNANLTTNGSNLGIGGSAAASAALDVTSTTQGTRPFPTMTTTQRNAISSPATGLLIFNSTDSVQQYYNGATWIDLSDYRVSRRLSNKIEQVNEFYSLDNFTGSTSGSAISGIYNSTNTDPSFGLAYNRITTATSSARLATSNNSGSAQFHASLWTGNPFIFETRIKLDTCNATDTLLAYIGLDYAIGVTTTSYSSTFGGFVYDPRNTLGQGASRFIQCLTRNASTNTTTVTSQVFNPTTYTKLKIVATSTIWLFYINDVLVATSTTNLPVNTSIGYSYAYRYTKTVGSNGANMIIDYWSLEHYLDTKR